MNICPCCKQKIRKLNPHRMDRQKVLVLEMLAKLKHLGHEWVRVTEGREIVAGGRTYETAYLARVHANRLVWFGLAQHGPPRSAQYQITQIGEDFLLGRASVPETIWCRDAEVFERSYKYVSIQDVKHVVLDKAYWDSYALRQKKHF